MPLLPWPRRLRDAAVQGWAEAAFSPNLIIAAAIGAGVIAMPRDRKCSDETGRITMSRRSSRARASLRSGKRPFVPPSSMPSLTARRAPGAMSDEVPEMLYPPGVF